MAKSVVLVLVCAACASVPPPAAKPVVAVVAPSADLAITERAMGRIDGKTRSTLVGLRAALPGYEVRPVYDGGLEYHVYKDGEHLYYVIPTTGAADRVFNVHVVSGKFALALHPWRAGQPFRGAAQITNCECWGDEPVCYKTGEHTAVAFKRACEGLSDGDERSRGVLDGVAVQRLIWAPSGFGVPSSTDPPEVPGEGGGVEGESGD